MRSNEPQLSIFMGESEECVASTKTPLTTPDKTDPITLELMKLSQCPEHNWNYIPSALHLVRWLQSLIPATQEIDEETADTTQKTLLKLVERIQYSPWLQEVPNEFVYLSIHKELNKCWRDIRKSILGSAPNKTHVIPRAPEFGTPLLRVYTESKDDPA